MEKLGRTIEVHPEKNLWDNCAPNQSKGSLATEETFVSEKPGKFLSFPKKKKTVGNHAWTFY